MAAKIDADGEYSATGRDPDLFETLQTSKRQRKTDIERVMQHVMGLLGLEYEVPHEFKAKLTEQLLAISDFLHFITKEKVTPPAAAGAAVNR